VSETLITRRDVEEYVHDTLPWDELSDWDLDAIVEEMTAAWSLCGHHPEILDAPIGALGGGAGWFIERHIDSDKYWAIVAKNQTA